jgi:hypothetical protein
MQQGGMIIPDILKPTSTQEIELPSGTCSRVPKCSPAFRPWCGPEIQDTYNGKQLLDVGGKPAFAELAILWALREAGWDGVWIDTYRRVFRTDYWHNTSHARLADSSSPASSKNL